MGSVTHCVGMCGPFVLSQTARLLDDTPLPQLSNLTRLCGAALLPYHLGRMTTYALLGVVSASLSAQLRTQDWFTSFSAVMLCLAGVFFLLSAFPSLQFVSLPLRSFFPSLSVKVSDGLLKPIQSLFAHPRGIHGYFLGLALGLLPCGLVYAALFSVAARGEPLTAALGMVMFALGTMPALVVVGAGGQFAFQKFRKALRFAFPVLMIMNSLMLFAMAGGLVK